MSIGIYRLLNTVTGESYVGASRDLEARLRVHAGKLARGSHPNKELLKSYQECGEDRFEISVIEECDLRSLTVREKYWAAHFNATLGRGVTASYPDMTWRDKPIHHLSVQARFPNGGIWMPGHIKRKEFINYAEAQGRLLAKNCKVLHSYLVELRVPPPSRSWKSSAYYAVYEVHESQEGAFAATLAKTLKCKNWFDTNLAANHSESVSGEKVSA